MRSLFRLLALATTISSAIAPSIARELSTQEAVHALAETLTNAGEQAFNKDGRFPSPQILFGIGGTFAYGSCQSASGSTIIPGSFYCPKTNTIILEYSQLEALRTRFGDGAVVYALAHEYAHYIQKVFGIKQPITLQELQADCIAGAILSSASSTLGLDQRDILEVVSAAASIGGGSHGTSEQRSDAVMFGLEKGKISACITQSNPAPTAIRPKAANTPNQSTNRPETNNARPTGNKPSNRVCADNYSLGGNSKGFIACYSVRKNLSNGDKFIALSLTHPKDGYLHKMVTTGNNKGGYKFMVLSCSRRQAHLAYSDGQLMKETSPEPTPLSHLWTWNSIDDTQGRNNPLDQEAPSLRRICGSK
jgi:hypothetical protein